MLLEKYPHLRVVMHSDEAPFLVGGKPYKSLEGASISMRLLVGNGLLPKKQTQARILV